jgi:PIN domain nuclease of toxin-antitoxin system
MSDTVYVLDASALLCLLFREPGAERIATLLPGASISAANLAEVIAKLVDSGEDPVRAAADLAELDLDVVPFDAAQAAAAGALRAGTRAMGLSPGDRCCLALAQHLRATAVTTDRAWHRLVPGVAVEVVR